jgi:signal transduction histidine kinase
MRAASLEVERLTQLSEDLLLIARADRGRLPLQLETIDASALLGRVVERFGWRAAEAGRALAVQPSGAIPVVADAIRIEQALGNLVDNALRYGAGEIGLAASAADGSVELHVTDEGRGFPPGFVDRAFERFARPDQARASGGSGLGLSIVKAVAEAHGGSAHAANRDPGADVWVALPTR